MFDIITIGSATRDVFLRLSETETREHSDSSTGIEQCFPLGSKLEVKEAVFTTGGGGTNAAVTFARQGLQTVCVGVVGDDLNGNEIISELKKENIESVFQIDQKGTTAYSVILVHSSGERTILSYKGEGQYFDVAKIPFDQLRAKWLFLDSLGGHYDLLETSVGWAKDNGIKLVANPGGKELEHGLEKLRPLLKNFSVIIMNQEEAAKLSGIGYKNEMEIFKFMDELIDGIFVMTKGHDGVVVSNGVDIYKAGVPDSPVIERTGAGDAFSSGFIVEYLRSGDISKAIQFATANASSVVAMVGSKAGILKKDDWGSWELVKVDREAL